MSGVQTPLTSEVFPLVVQRAVKLNRLVHPASVLQNQTVMVSCRVNAGTDIIFLWDFGDGTTRLGESSEQHVFHRTGEYRIEVTASNLVSSASLMSHIFVVDRPCQPPPVKNMGPLKVQVRRYEVIRLGVTYETEVDCDTTRGLRYTWTMFDSVGRIFPLTLIDTHRQTLVLRSHLLHYDTYTAVARVQVVGSVVYSNYSVRVQVMPSLPVASIQGSTNIFINRRNGTTITLDGWRSYDPDYPGNTVSFSWTCDPVSSIRGSCFNQPVETSHARLTFPVNLLKNYFDQFRFTLAVRSRDFAASTETFITITSNVIGTVSVHCPQCGGDQVTWDQSFSVNASCENCGVSPEQVQYTWSLYLVNASSKPVVDVDLSAPSTVVESPSGWLRPPAAEASHYPQTLITGLTEPERPPPSSPATTTASGEEFLDHPQEEVEPLLSSTDPPRLGAGGVLLSQTDVISESLIDSDSSADWEFSFPALAFADAGDQSDYDAPFPVAEEGDPGVSAGRPTGVDGETLSPGDVSAFDPVSHDTEGSNLVDSSPSAVIQEPTLLDLPREPVDRGLFESYTFTGIFSPSLSFRPSSLRSGSRYMLEVTAKTPSNLLGRTQIFLKTTSSPKGMTCQVQPLKGMELYTHFSIFCTSGREDLVYEYSFSIGSRPPRILYQGRNFQYYFSLPSGDHSDEYNVTIYTRIRSSTYGTSTKLCPVTVQVRPSFVRDISLRDPDLELSESGLKNLSALVQLGNSVEIRNYISLLSSILNRLSQDARANIHIQRRIRSVLICSVCELESSEQASMVDSILILKDLLKVTSQVTFASVRRATDHVQAVSEQLSRAPVGQHLHQETLHSLVTVLSYSLQAAVTGGEESHHTDMRHPKYILFSKLHEHQVSSGVMSFYATYLNQTSSSVISSGSTTVYLPSSLLQSILSIPPRGECVLSLLTHSSYTGAHTPGRIRGRAVELSLYKCSTRRRIPVGSLVQPVITELPRKHQSPALKYVLMRSRVNYHSFNITQEYLQQAIQLTVVFTPPSNRTFPIMLLFRMFEKPTPSMHHLQKIYHWESNTWRMTMPPSYLNAAGVGYLAVLNADFEKPLRHTHLSSQVNYTLTVESSQCLSWDHRRGAWTHLGCTTQQTDRTDSVSCSCHHLRPLTVVQQQIQIHHDTTDLDPFLSLSCNLSVLAVLLLLCVCLYIPGWLMCRRADVTSEQSLRVHYLTDNAPQHQHLYAVTTHTGVFSAPCMSAKVYMVLYGDDGVSQTRELQVPGCTLFRRNSQDTFILSAADSLGPLWGVHIWHDNSGPAPSWYLKQVEVAEVTRGYETRRTWFFLSQCWLAVDKGDGQVERMLRVFTKEIGFTQMLTLKLLDYLADFHIWISVCSLPHPSSFTHTQRLSVSLLLLSGYACVSAGIISQLEEPLPLELGITAVSAVSVTTGVLSVLAWLPPASLIAFLFRLREGKVVGSGGRRADVKKSDYDCFEDAVRVNDSIFESRLYWSNLQQWAQEAWRKKYQGADQMSASTGNLENKAAKVANPTDVVIKQEDAQATESSTFKNSFLIIDADKDVQAWTLCLLLSLLCLVASAVLGLSFSSSEVLLWIHSLLFSLLSCIFLIQPLVIAAAAVTASLLYRHRPGFQHFRITEFQMENFKLYKPHLPQERNVEKLLGTRQRARYLRLVRPPSPADLRKTRGKKRREALIYTTLRDFCVCVSMLFLMLCVTSSSSLGDHYSLNKAVRQQFIGGGERAFMSIKNHEDWWKWTQTSLLHLLYKNASTTKMLLSSWGKALTNLPSDVIVPMETPSWTCSHLRCYQGSSTTVGLGHSKQDAVFKLKVLHAGGWLGRETVALKVQFTLYSPVPNLFTSVTLFAEQSPTGGLLPLVEVQSVRIYHSPAVWDYVVMVCQLFFLVLSLLNLCFQIYAAGQQGLMGYGKTPRNWGLLPSGQEFYLSSTAVWTAVVIGVAPLSIRNATRPRSSKDVCTLAELRSYVRQRVCEFAGHRTPAWNNGESRTYYLEEFEGLVDELLFRLNALSNSLHHAFPPKASHFREDSPTTSLSQYPLQSLERASSTEEVSDLSHPRVPSDGTAAPHPLRVPVQTHRRDDSPPESSATSDNGTNAGAKSNVLQASSNRQNVRSLPESASVMELWRTDHPVSQSVLGDIPERQTSQWTETSDTLSKSGKCGTAHTTTQATHTEVIVEVLVHEEPASGENI
ncbi:polycystin-1-like protein 1 [Aulostomus maculatus]